MKFWIGNDPELSEKVQKLLFDAGYSWPSDVKTARYNHEFALYANSGGNLTRNSDSNYFIGHSHEEININWMRTTKPETIELNGKIYIKSELEEALLKIKPVN
jgi:hypothetical protein